MEHHGFPPIDGKSRRRAKRANAAMLQNANGARQLRAALDHRRANARRAVRGCFRPLRREIVGRQVAADGPPSDPPWTSRALNRPEGDVRVNVPRWPYTDSAVRDLLAS